MFLLAFRNLRARTGRTLFTALAIALGVALVFATRMVGVAVEGQAGAARAGRLAGADLEVVSANGALLNDNLADTRGARLEVALAAPIYRNKEGQPTVNGSTVTYVGTGLNLLGVDPTRPLTSYELTAGNFFSAPEADEVLLPLVWAAVNGVGIGDKVSLTTGLTTHDYLVIGLIKEKSLPGSPPTAGLPLQTLQAAFDLPDAASSVYLQLQLNQSLPVARRINEIVLGKRAISPDTALQLSRYFDMTERFGFNLQARYDLEVEKDKLGSRLEREVAIYAQV